MLQLLQCVRVRDNEAEADNDLKHRYRRISSN